MSERNNVVKSKGAPLTLLGNEVKVGKKAPDFTVLDENFEPVGLSDFGGKTLVLTTVPSIDTSVCDMETRRFNQEAAKLGDDVAILTISMDLPTAQKRWCGATGVDRVKLLSDIRDRSFGNNYGVLIKELGLLARTVFIVDSKGIIRYIQYVEETSTEPDYGAVISALKDILS